MPLLLILDTAWWLTFATAFGLVVGSFLNVVIFRIPLGLSVNEPKHSFCPYCGSLLRWFDNLPVVSYVALGGRCRTCRTPISMRYPIIELLFAIIVLLLVDTFMVAQVRAGLLSTGGPGTPGGVSWSLIVDGPVLLAHVILFAALLAMSAIDMEFYWVDIRATHLAAACGFVLHALWTPASSISLGARVGWPRPDESMAVACCGAMVGLLISAWFNRRVPILSDETEPGPTSVQESNPNEAPETLTTADPVTNGATVPKSIWALVIPWILILVLVGLWVGAFMQELLPTAPATFEWRALLAVAVCFVVMLAQSTVHRESDVEIAEAIHAEQSSARLVALGEFAMLLPSVICAAMAWVGYQAAIEHGLFSAGNLYSWGWHQWHPLLGLGTAATGYVIGGAVGWGVRIAFTMLLGKEALGTGDIHILAAAGAVVGWQIAAAGFILSSMLALLGLLLILPFKRARTIPLGPWLSLAFLILVVYYEDFIALPTIVNLVSAFRFIVLGES